jgi:hypothetical protein
MSPPLFLRLVAHPKIVDRDESRRSLPFAFQDLEYSQYELFYSSCLTLYLVILWTQLRPGQYCDTRAGHVIQIGDIHDLNPKMGTIP